MIKHRTLYKKWSHIKDMCNNPKHCRYKNYGGRGIKVCDEWKDYLAFDVWSLANGYIEGHNQVLGRIDINGNYSPENCRYTDLKTQSNNRRNNHIIEYDGKALTIQQWCDLTGLSNDTLEKRIKRGWSLDRVFGQKQQKKKFKNRERFNKEK